ncbi:MAG: S8 family serine peptidase, partial [Solirubrobacterales bacterium]
MTAPAITILLLAVSILAPPAFAEFPYSRPGSDTGDFKDLYLDPGSAPGDLAEKEVWMYSATPEPGNLDVNLNPAELNGVRGGHIVDADGSVDAAWQVTTGRPDVAIAVLDSGIKWDDAGAMQNLRFKTHLNRGELPQPQNDLATPNEPGEDCSAAGPYQGPGYDLNGDGVFNLLDYSCDSRTPPDPALNVAPAMFEPQDLLIAFSNGSDDDGNGYVDDIVGWDFLDDDNDPYDDVQYGHGTGEALDSVAEAENGQDGVGTCPNCMAMHMRVGDSFIADVNRFAAATTYAVDNGALVIQEALGTVNNTTLAREAVGYAYRHGVAVIASAADEAAQHNNWPSSLPHVILVNSVTKYTEFADLPDPLPSALTEQPRSYLKFNGCTNFNSKVTVAIPSVSCSSDATGRGAGIAGLIYSAALDALDRGKLEPHPDCTLAVGGACPITANEVRQLMASGTVGGQSVADDVNFSQSPEPSCSSPVPQLPTCTDPFLGRGVETTLPVPLIPVVSLIPTSKRYPARAGHDQFYGYGRANVSRSVNELVPRPFADAEADSRIPPEVEITAPDWFDQVDPEAASVAIEGEVFARGAPYRCTVLVAPGHYPNNAQTPAGDFAPVPSSQCDGRERTDSFAGVLADLDVAALRDRFPATVGDFDGREPALGIQTASGRPNTAPYGFVVKVVATTTGSPALSGEDRRAMYLHRDADMLEGFPRKLDSDGESSPALVDLDGDNRAELVVATADGFVHAYRRDPETGEVSELPGWPVRGDVPGFVASHAGAPAYASGDVSDELGGAFITAVAAADADHDGAPEVYAADLEGKVYGWNAAGERVFEVEAEPDFSGKPLAPFENVRIGKRNRTQHGFAGSPVLADLDRDDGGQLEVIAAGMDRHVYAWNHDGTPVDGFPVLVVDESKVESVDPQTHAVTFGPQAEPSLMQGAIVDTPAVGDIAGDARPEIIVGTNEEYAVDEGNEGPFNVAASSAPSLTLLEPLGLLDFANGRAYAISPDGDPDAPATGASPFLAGWPVPIAIALAELLPIVGEGINGSPVIADLDCSSGGPGAKVGTMPAAGLAYLLNADGSSCFGAENGRHRTFSTDLSAGVGQLDRPVLPAVGLPAFGDLGGPQPSFIAPGAGIIRAIDLALNEYQAGGQDFVVAWDTATGLMSPGWPSPVNDLQFLTGPAVGDVGGLPGEEVVAGTASMDLTALNGLGLPTSIGWPKLTTDWTIATPLLGSFGTLDTAPEARRVVVGLTRSGYVNVYGTEVSPCAPASSPRFHHDNANSGDYRRDAALPGVPYDGAVDGTTVEFKAPGDDLLCGAADAYEVVTARSPVDEASFASATPLAGAPDPGAPGSTQVYELPPEALRYVAIRAVDEQGNVGRPLLVDRGPGASPPPGGG